MFIEGRHDLKTPMHYGEVNGAIKHVDEQHKLMGKKLECLTFDRESAIVVMQDDIEVGIQGTPLAPEWIDHLSMTYCRLTCSMARLYGEMR